MSLDSFIFIGESAVNLNKIFGFRIDEANISRILFYDINEGIIDAINFDAAETAKDFFDNLFRRAHGFPSKIIKYKLNANDLYEKEWEFIPAGYHLSENKLGELENAV